MEQLCEKCGNPEPSKHQCPEGKTFVCSRCVQEMLGDYTVIARGQMK